MNAFRLLYFGSHRDAAEALGKVSHVYTGGDLDYYRRAAASPGTIETLATIEREVDVRHILSAVRVPTLIVHAVGESAFPIEGARYMAERISGAKLIEVPGNAPFVETMLEEAERFLRGVTEAGGWEESEPGRVLATVLFTDIVGSSERAASLGDRAWHELLDRHHELVRRQLMRFRGTEVNTAGDGFLASFDGPARAIRCACAIVGSMSELGLEIRAGLHTGPGRESRHHCSSRRSRRLRQAGWEKCSSRLSRGGGGFE